MLCSLRIKNLALVEDLTLEFAPGFCVITGETGAGKSILIGALDLLLGQRAERTLIRSGTDACTVEAVFEVSALKKTLDLICEENGLEQCQDGELLLKRSFSATGSNRQFVNGSPAALTALGQIGDLLVDIHGPHDHQSLFQRPRQLAFLDAFAGTQGLRDQFGELVAKRSAVIKQVGELFVDERTYQQRLDLLQHQVNEISAAKLQSGEEEELEQEYIRASNAARLMELCQTAQNHLAEDEAGLIQQAGAIGRAMQELQRLDPAAGCLGSLHEQMVLAIRDFQADLGHYFDKLELDPSRLALLEERLNLIKSLKRKYGGSIDDILQFADQAQNELSGLQNRETDLAKLRDQRMALEKQLVKLGAELTAARNKARTAFEKGVVTHLKELGFQQSLFAVSIQSEKSPDFETYTPKPSGLDEIDFLFAPNPGEPPKPLRSIASSGELARVMLALKSVLASVDDVPVLVFDEIDANVGGETTRRIASQMRKLGERRQVICITHAAPIAAFGTQHYVVSKHSSLLRTTTSIQVVTKQDRVKELARMLGGESKASVQHAEALLKEAAGL